MERLVIPAREDLTLDQFVDLLATNVALSGILFMGSTAAGSLRPSSDIDLLVVFDELPANIQFVNTWVEGRLTEIYCTSVDVLRGLAAGSTIPATNEEGIVVGWLRSGKIAFDRRGLLASACAAAGAIDLIPPSDSAAYGAWRSVGYNAAQLLRYAASPEPDATVVIEMRLLYSLADVMVAYFTTRRLVWRGEKAAIAYWHAHDPSFLERYRAALSEHDMQRKVNRYVEVARLSVEPVGSLWAVGTTMVGLGPGFASGDGQAEEGDIGLALATWDALFEIGI